MHVAPQVMNVSANRLSVDTEVQRGLDQVRVDKMVKDFRPEGVGVLIVSQRPDGSMRIIDGQHRHAAAVASGYDSETLPCLVYTGLSVADEAAMFRRLNNTKAVQPIDKFRVRVVEGDETAVALNELLKRHGWRVDWSKYEGCFAAVTALENLYSGKTSGDYDGPTACDAALGAITKAWGRTPHGVRAELIGGVGRVFARHGSGVDVGKLVNELAGSGQPIGLSGKAKQLRDIRGGTLPDAVAEIVVEMLNKQRRAANRLPEWRSAA